MNIIGNSCVASYLIRDFLKQDYHNPFTWNVIGGDSMYNLIKSYDTIDFMNYNIIYNEHTLYPTIIIDDIINVHYVHYKYDANCTTPIKKSDVYADIYYNDIVGYAESKYISRVKKMLSLNEPPIFLLAAGFTQSYYYSKECIKKIIDIKTPYKIIIMQNNLNGIKTSNKNVLLLHNPFVMNKNYVHSKMAEYLYNNEMFINACGL